MKYDIIFNLTTGRDIHITLVADVDLNDVAVQDRFANGLVDAPFRHFYENGQLVIINMANVAHIKISKAE